MVEDTLVREPLTSEKIIAGAELIKRLRVDLDIVGAFWVYTSEAGRWRLIIVAPVVEIDGPQVVYGQVWDVIYGNSNNVRDSSIVHFTEIEALGPQKPVVRELATLNAENALSEKRLGPLYLGGSSIEDGYLYFLDVAPTGATEARRRAT